MFCIDRTAPRQAMHGLASTRAAEHRHLAGLPEGTLMARAGAALARLALAIAPHASCIWIAAGKGNNGGDGLHAALRLVEAGKKVVVTIEAPSASAPFNASTAALLQHLLNSTATIATVSPPLGPQDLAIDALLGIGAVRAPDEALASRITELNRHHGPVLAVDLPSGLDGDTGQPLGAACVRATHTLSLLTLHPGLFTAEGRDHAGVVWLDRLGVNVADMPAADAWLAGAGSAARLLPGRAHVQHKGSFGDVCVIGGAQGMHGAALLAARAAHACGAGRVYVSLLDPQGAAIDFMRPELMFRKAWWTSGTDILAATTVVCGCGGGTDVNEALSPLLLATARLVLDADALNAVAGSDALRSELQARAGRGQPTILTPHPLEAARLLGTATKDIQADRLGSAARIAGRYGCVVVLKGSGTVIAAPGEPPIVNPTGNSSLATAGTGDVLAGWTGGLWAQAALAATDLALRVATGAAYMHGAAADEQPLSVLRADDLVQKLHEQLDSGRR